MQEPQSIDSFDNAALLVANAGPVRVLLVGAVRAQLSSTGSEHGIDVANHENATLAPARQGCHRVFRKPWTLGRNGLDGHSQRLQVWDQHARNLPAALDVPGPGIDVHDLLEELQLAVSRSLRSGQDLGVFRWCRGRVQRRRSG